MTNDEKLKKAEEEFIEIEEKLFYLNSRRNLLYLSNRTVDNMKELDAEYSKTKLEIFKLDSIKYQVEKIIKELLQLITQQKYLGQTNDG